MKPGIRALGIAESYQEVESTVAGAVVRADRVVDDYAFATCTVGGQDATDAVTGIWAELDRPDVRYVLLAGIAPAWYNLLDLSAIADATERPVLSVSFEASPGLEPALRTEFSGDDLAWRLETYGRQPPRERLSVNGESVWVRAVGCTDDDPGEIVRTFTPEGGRPEPLRVARLAARAGDAFRRRWADS